MKYKIPKKIAMINDIAGFGRCSTTVALPVISAMKVQACPVPTSVFSNHTGFPIYHFDDYTDNMTDYLDAWDKLGLSFDGILCGFLGSVRQIQIVEQFILKQANSPLVILDPVMGDHGQAYHTITEEHCREMKKLIQYSDMITPNITEACLLTGTPYQDNGWVPSDIQNILRKLHQMGPSQIAITGIQEDDYYVNYIFSEKYKETDCFKIIRSEAAGESRPGTGDIFASILAADAVNGTDFYTSVQKASDFIRICTDASSQAGIPVPEGVCFENFLEFLWNNNSGDNVSK